MKTKLVTQILVTLVVIFGLGGLCGYAMSGRFHSGQPSQTQGSPWAKRWVEKCMADDFAAIHATPEQEEVLKPVYEALLQDFQAIQQEAAARVGVALRARGREIGMKLTPAQLEAFQQSHRQRRILIEQQKEQKR